MSIRRFEMMPAQPARHYHLARLGAFALGDVANYHDAWDSRGRGNPA